MLLVSSAAPPSSASRTPEYLDISNPEDPDIWFDAIDHVEMEETWFDTHEEHQTDPSASAGKAADSRVPFTEDCRRGVQQFVRTLGQYGKSRMLSACLSGLLPGTPTNLVIAANSLYTAVTERRNIDSAALHALGLVSEYLPDNINVISRLAAFIRDTVAGWTDETFLQQFYGNEENRSSIHLFTALAITALVTSRWMKDEGGPQRGILKVPAFIANIFIRASHYWTALGNMASNLPSGVEMQENIGLSQRIPAFVVDTQVELTGDVCDATTPCSPSAAPRLTAFSSNSTASPETYTRSTVQNRPAPVSGKNIQISLPEQAHYMVVEKLRQESGLSDLLYCATGKTETRQQTNEKIITNTHFNTKCDAIVYPEPLTNLADNVFVFTDTPKTQVSSPATGRSNRDTPQVTTAAVTPIATSYIQALKSKSGIAAGVVAGLKDNPLSASISAFVSGRDHGLSPLVSQNTASSDNSDTGFGTLLGPVANALHETGQFIARYDPLIFPAADASPMPLAETESTMAAGISHDVKSDSYIITDERKKDELISSLVQYLVSDGQLTADESDDAQLWLRSEAAGMPIVAASLDNESSGSNRTRRALRPELDPRTGEHIKEHCAFEEELLYSRGNVQGKILIFDAQRAEYPFRMIYDTNPDRGPSPEERGVALGLDILADFFTLGIKPIIGKIIATSMRWQHYRNLGDKICTERFRRVLIAEVATSLDVTGLAFSPQKSAGKAKPSELLHALPEQKRAAFYTRNPHSGIQKEILLELKQGKGAINDNGRNIYLKPTDKTNEFVTYHPKVVKPELLERRVIVDENDFSWRYADEFDSSGLNVKFSEGKQQINLHGENYELHLNAVGKYEIVVNKASGIKKLAPVYMEPLSQTWHLSTHNEHPVFISKQIDIIKKIKVNKENGFYYVPRGNNNRNSYGNGNIYVQEKKGDSGHYPWGRYVEMNGELVPVRHTKHQGQGVLYEIYDMKLPENKGHPIEWDGNRWLFEKKTSVHVSKILKKLISPKMVSEKVDAGKLSAPDHQGLRYDADKNSYLKIKGEYLKLNKQDGRYFIKMNNGERTYVSYIKNKFTPSMSPENALLQFKKKLNLVYVKTNKNKHPNVCYSYSAWAGRVDGVIPRKVEKFISKMKNGYSKKYKKMMGITNKSYRSSFDIDGIIESGLINFAEKKSKKLVHTVYIRVDKWGQKILFNANGLNLDKAILSNGHALPEQVGGGNLYTINKSDAKNIQKYLDEGYVYHYTKGSELI